MRASRESLRALPGIALLGVAAWAYTFHITARMGSGMAMSPAMGVPALAVMWIVMMSAMMAPAAAPSYLLYAGTVDGPPLVRAGKSAAYLAGYLTTWGAFSVAAATLQWWLQRNALVGHGVALSNVALSGTFLVVTGLYQWTPVKARCARRCRSPLGFILTEWRDGAGGGWWMGVRYGGFCLGCCWLLMGVMFVVGVMSFTWMAVLSAYVLLERLIRAGRWLDRAVGAGLIAWGMWLLAGNL